MPNLYMGRGGLDGMFNSAAPIVSQYPSPAPAQNAPPGTPPGQYSGLPASTTVTTPPTARNVLGSDAIRPTGPTKGYDPAYLQNLATSIGALFARPEGNLRFNPLGDLSEISPPSNLGGNAPGYGAPLTWLQQALNGLGFSFNQPTPPAAAGAAAANRSGNDNGFNPRGPVPRYLS